MSGSWTFEAVSLAPDEARRLAIAARPELAFDDPAAGGWFGCGEAVALEHRASAPFEIVEEAERILAELHRPNEITPAFLGGFAFDPARTDVDAWSGFPAGRLVLPELTFHLRDARAWALLVGPQARDRFDQLRHEVAQVAHARAVEIRDVPERERWDASMARALEAIARGQIEKIVLARTIEVRLSESIDAVRLLPALRARFPSCAVYLVRRGEKSFIGATPEWLFAREGDRLETMALAGTMRLDADPSALLADSKERREHAFVADAIVGALKPHALELDARGPEVRSLPNVHHLQTRIRAQLRPGTSTRALLEALHPTPAVCGTPRESAAAMLPELESFARGWYAGPLGVVACDGARFSVALRGMLLDHARARVFAGAGVVSGSSAEREWNETAIKAEAMLRVLREEPA